MDLIDQLSNPRTKRSGFVKKLHFFDDEPCPTVGGTGFLFENSIFNQVKKRIKATDDNEINHNVPTTASTEILKDTCETQAIERPYDGEELETDFVLAKAPSEPKDNEVRASQSSSRLKFQAQQEFTASGETRLDNHKEADIANTQLIGDSISSTSVCDEDLETQKTSSNDMITSLTTQKIDLSHSPIKGTLQATSRDDNLEPPTVDDREISEGIMHTNEADIEVEHDHSNIISKSSKSKPMVLDEKYGAQKFIDEFDEDSDVSECEKEASNPEAEKSNLKETSERRNLSLNVLPSISEGFAPLQLYHTILKQRLADANSVEFSSSDDEKSSEARSLSSKAAILDLKARMSKKKQSLAVTSSKETMPSASLRHLFSSLRKANRDQLVEHRNGLLLLRGVDLAEIAKEKESVESLLERELARNKKVKQEEIQKGEDSSSDEFCNDSSSSLGSHSDSADDSDGYDDYNQEVDESVDTEVVDLGPLKSKHELSVKTTNLTIVRAESDEEDDPLNVTKKKKIRRWNLIDSDDEALSNDEQKTVIDLGAYGENILGTERIDEGAGAQVVGTGSSMCEAKLERNTTKLPVRNLNRPREEKIDQDEETRNSIIKNLIEKQKLKEALREAKMKELNRSKANGMIDFEAEESDDEWFGVGGADGENSDGYDSELDRMIDDYSNTKSDPEFLRKKLMEEEKLHDKDMVDRILHDIENGGFRKRGRYAMDLTLSDDEDDDLLRYHARRKELLNERKSGNQEISVLATNPKSKAFFDSIFEDDLKGGIANLKEYQSHASPLKAAKDEISGKRETRISEQFVQKTLSFLKSKEDEQGDAEFVSVEDTQESSSGDFAEATDFYRLKQLSGIKSFSAPLRSSIRLQVRNKDGALSGKANTTLVERFVRSVDTNEKFEEGRKTVKSLNSYKIAGSSRASITFLGKARSLKARKRGPHARSAPHGQKIMTSHQFFASDGQSFEN